MAKYNYGWSLNQQFTSIQVLSGGRVRICLSRIVRFSIHDEATRSEPHLILNCLRICDNKGNG